MERYNEELIPDPFGLVNIGVICYFNSFLQTLSGCSAFTYMVLSNKEHMYQTNTGTAMYNFVFTYTSNPSEVSNYTIIILKALIGDLKKRRPTIQFGHGQESAHEVFILLLDMMEPETYVGVNSVGVNSSVNSVGVDGVGVDGVNSGVNSSENSMPSSLISSISSPITKLFLHKCEWNTSCIRCNKILSKKIDYGVIFDLHHIDDSANIEYIKASLGQEHIEFSPQIFSNLIKHHISNVEGYFCDVCHKDDKVYRIYNLKRIPEIVFCSFNIYYQQSRKVRYFPPYLEYDTTNKEKMNFKLIGQIEHSGTLSGGHYWAKGLRKNGEVFELNDMSISKSEFQSSPRTYMIIYHLA
jgi:ubiquitin C-terminal hydrolase